MAEGGQGLQDEELDLRIPVVLHHSHEAFCQSAVICSSESRHQRQRMALLQRMIKKNFGIGAVG